MTTEPDSDLTAALAESLYTLTPRSLRHALRHMFKRRTKTGKRIKSQVAIVSGPVGIGKTELIYAIAREFGFRPVVIHAPQLNPVDLRGLAVHVGNGEVRWVPWSYLPAAKRHEITVTPEMVKKDQTVSVQYGFRYAENVLVYIENHNGAEIFRFNDQMLGNDNTLAASVNVIHPRTEVQVTLPKGMAPGKYTIVVEDKALILIDELRSASDAVMKSLLQVMAERRCGEWELPTSTPLCAATNSDRDIANVMPLIASMANRCCNFRLEPNAKEWLQDFAFPQAVHPAVTTWVEATSRVYNFDSAEYRKGHHGFMTPRSLTNLSDKLWDDIEIAADGDNEFDTTTESDRSVMARRIERAIAVGFLGPREALSFMTHRDLTMKLPNAMDIIEGKVTEVDDAELDISMKNYLALMLSYALGTFADTHLDRANNNSKGQSDTWLRGVNNYYAFISKTFEDEICSMCLTHVTKRAKIHINQCRTDGMNQFAKSHADVMRRIYDAA